MPCYQYGNISFCIPDPVQVPSSPTNNTPPANLGSSPGLSTSTGGLFGIQQMYLVPVVDRVNSKIWLDIIDPSNFNCENDWFYIFPSQEVKKSFEGKEVTISKVVLTYREIGAAKFTVGVVAYRQADDNFVGQEQIVKIADVKGEVVNQVNPLFPDGQLHTIALNFLVQGQRPYAYIKGKGNSGSVSITNFMLVGHADVAQIM